MRKGLAVILVIFLMSCKSKAVLIDTKTPISAIKADTALTSGKIIANHYRNKVDFSTLYIRANAKYKSEDESQSVTAEVKIKKDQQILVSIRVLGITMAKALITPQEVKYYEKINGTYFEGDYQLLSQWLGTDLDYNKIQNMLVGKPIDDLTQEMYTLKQSATFFTLNSNKEKTEKSFSFDATHFLLKQQEINQAEKERSFVVNYPNFQEISSMSLPASLTINAFQKNTKTSIAIEYNSIAFNEELNFPYSVPSGYDRIFIKQN
jgi:hypothetical protein